MSRTHITIGLDIGGANLKAAIRYDARSRPFELWKHPDQLGAALIDLLQEWTPARLAVTMTGELCDCFTTKRDGVQRILAHVEQAFPGIPIGVWSTDGRFIGVDVAHQYPLAVAAANWHALATQVGKSGTNLLIDVGSTTSDIIPIIDGKPAAQGLNDVDRLRSKELVYTGVRRTPVYALIQDGIMPELFATTLDVYLSLGLIAEDGDDCLTADGRSATAENAHARLARMLGGDAEMTSARETLYLASQAFVKQKELLRDAINAALGRLAEPPRHVTFSGSGEFLARAVWGELSMDHVPVQSLAESIGVSASHSACACAVAILAEELWPG